VALWLQIVLSFGHLHQEDVFGPTGLSATATPSLLNSRPVDPHDIDMPADGCAICAVMAMMASSIVPDTLALPDRRSDGFVPVIAGSSFLIAEPFYRLFQTRAPPGLLND
jgi:hypothetical protein